MKLFGTDGKRLFNFDLVPGRLVLGRLPECDLYVQDSTVSRRHAEIELDSEGKCFVTDLGSHNGTTVDGKRITDRTELPLDGCVCFGQVEFRFQMGGASDHTSSQRTATKLSEIEPENSVFLSINEALQPLPSKITELADLFPTFAELARMLVLPEPKEIMLERALELVARVIPAERLAVLFTSEDESEVYTAAMLLPSGRDPGTFRLSRTIVKDIFLNKNAILIGDVGTDSRFGEQQSIVALAIQSAMAVPLFDDGKVLGILYVDTANPVHRYSDEYLRLLATFGNIIAARLLNYELLYERQEKEIIDAELARASQIQNALLSDMPELTGYQICAYQQQCRAVGGDLYDVEKLPDGRLLFLIADVSGKGMGAALLMSNILASFRILYVQRDFSLVRAVSEVSRQLFRFSAPGDFATLFVGVIDPGGHSLSFVNAGHNPPIVLRTDGSHQLLEASGTMIGAFDISPWEEQTITLAGGDLICVFTDGVSEAETADGSQYGEERLLQILVRNRTLPASSLSAEVVRDVELFVGDAPRSDDITLILVRREE